MSFICWHIYDLSFHLNRLPVAIRQRRTVRSGQERCYLRCHSCSSYLGLIFLFSYHLAFVSFLFPFSLFLSHRCAQSARKLRGSLILSPSVRRWEKFLARPLKLKLKLLKEMKQIKFTVFSDPSRIMRPLWLWFCSGPWDLPRWGLVHFLLSFKATLTFPTFLWK